MNEGVRVLPSGWANSKISDFAIMSSGGTPSRKQSNYYDGNIPWAKIGDLDDGYVRETEEAVSDEGLKKSSAKLMPENTLLLAMYGASIGKLGITKIPLSTNQAIACIRPKDSISVEYLFHFFKLSRRDLIKLGQGGAQPNISQTILKRIDVPIAPVKEQERIVDKIDELFSAIEAGERAIEQARVGVARYRKAILKAAVTGELTRDWRDEHPTEESAEALLKRILTARYEAWEKSELEKLDAKGKARPETEKQWEKFREKYTPPVKPVEDFSFSIPENWKLVSVEAVTSAARVISYGVLQPGKEFSGGTRLVRVCDIKKGRIEQSKIKKIDPNIAEKYQRTFLRGGELLITLVGTVGRTAIVKEPLVGANVARAVGVLTVSENVNTHWLKFCFNEEKSKQNLIGSSREVARKTLNLEQLRSFPVPLPPLAEQTEIVNRVEQALSKAAAVEATLDAQSRQAKALKQAVLKTAFEGRLVPQNPKDEPASELLKRIKEQT